jgi:hypothetical protein
MNLAQKVYDELKLGKIGIVFLGGWLAHMIFNEVMLILFP